MIKITENIVDSLKGLLSTSNFDIVFVLTDTNSSKYCLPLISEITDTSNVITVQSGENSKNIETAQYVWEQLINKKATRHSFLINLGGGMITDLGGFCASTFLRGISFINVPTSLLGMVDASIGGKNGIDFLNYKNYIGTFNSPFAVFVAPEFLITLPDEEIKNGWAEVIKHAIIGDSSLWNLVLLSIPDSKDQATWKTIIEENIAVKFAFTIDDPTEKGKRKILNFGHTIGHGIESFFLEKHQIVKHGYCVAAGIIMESFIACKMNFISKDICESIFTVIKNNYPKLPFGHEDFDLIYKYILSDKKNHSGKIFMALPKDIGHMIFDVEVTENLISEALNFYLSYDSQSLR